MDINYLQNLLAKLILLGENQHLQAEQIKIHTIEAFKKLFPEDRQLIRSIQNLRLDRFNDMPSQHFRDLDLDSKNKLQAIIEAKIDLLKHLPVSKTMHELDQANQYLTSINKQHERTIETYRVELKKNDDKLEQIKEQYSLSKVKIHELEKKLKQRGLATNLSTIGFWALALTILGGAFTLGLYIGNTKYDKDKIELSDNNKALKDSILIYKSGLEYMRHNSDSAHQILGQMPYDEMTIDNESQKKVQRNIEAAGAVLYLNQKFQVTKDR